MGEKMALDKKKCGHCQKVLPISNFDNNYKEPDYYSFYCKDCQQKRHDAYFHNKTNRYEKKMLYKLRKENIPIIGLDIDKIKKTEINMFFYPGVMRPLFKDLVVFLPKYHLTYEEYIYISDKLRANQFWIN